VLSPAWFPAAGRSPLIGYACAILLPACLTLLSWIISLFSPDFTVRGLLLFCSALLIAYFWGTGPGLLSAITQTLLENVEHTFPAVTWPVSTPSIVQMISFLIFGVALCLLISRLEYARQAAYQARQHTRTALEALLRFAEELVDADTATDYKTTEENVQAGADRVAQQLTVLIGQILDYQLVSLTLFSATSHEPQLAAAYGLASEREQSWRKRQPGSTLGELLRGTPQECQLLAGEAVVMDLSEAPFTERSTVHERRRFLLTPMLLEKKLVGILTLGASEPLHAYSSDEINLGRALAELAALTLERHQLFQENLKEQARVLALSEANNLMDEFIGIAGHELRTPLTTMLGNTQLALRQINKMLQHQDTLPEEVSEAALMIKRHLSRVGQQVSVQNRLVSDLLDVTRIHANRLELYPERCNLLPLVRESINDQHNLVPDRQIELILSTPEDVFLMADADRVRQVIDNYLSNALKYSDPDKPVRVFVDLDGQTARVRVQDEGPGLTNEQQQRLWERFYRVPGIEVKNRSGSGLGLGLHICKMIIKNQGGQVGVQSTPGQGSTFWFTLPLANEQENRGETP
jgi:signal transduction histidine kinase